MPAHSYKLLRLKFVSCCTQDTIPWLGHQQEAVCHCQTNHGCSLYYQTEGALASLHSQGSRRLSKACLVLDRACPRLASIPSGGCAEVQGLLVKIGQAVAKLHDGGVVHGDLTTSNMIIKDSDQQVVRCQFLLDASQRLIHSKQSVACKHFLAACHAIACGLLASEGSTAFV